MVQDMDKTVVAKGCEKRFISYEGKMHKTYPIGELVWQA
jgi:hypothetical protein